MVSGNHRFHGIASLRFVYGRGQTVRGQYFAIKYALNPKRKNYRVAVVVSKKVDKSAVVRNRIRRRLYELVRQRSENITQPYDIALLVYSKDVGSLDSKKLANFLDKQLRSAKIL